MTRADMYSKQTHAGLLSLHELNKVRELFVRHVKPGDHVLVLGATAELRNIALEHKCKVMAVDISMEMISKRQHLVNAMNPNLDVVAKGNWLHPWFLRKHSFKAILADASFNNLEFKDMLTLFRLIKQLAEPGCVMVFRHISWFDELSINEIIDLFKKAKIDSSEMILSIYFHRKLDRSYKNNAVHVRESMTNMIEIFKKAGLSKEIQDYLANHIHDGIHNVVDQDKFHRILKKTFGNFRAHCCKSLLHGNCAPIYQVRIK